MQTGAEDRRAFFARDLRPSENREQDSDKDEAIVETPHGGLILPSAADWEYPQSEQPGVAAPLNPSSNLSLLHQWRRDSCLRAFAKAPGWLPGLVWAKTAQA